MATMATPGAASPEPYDVKADAVKIDKAANALTPPTSEEMNHEPKQEQEDSELSDLDMDDEDGEDIQPDHYWEDGKIPVFKPTMEQFRSFKKFIHKIDKYGMKSGIVKVIPPQEWRETLPPLDDYVKRIKIKNPITQEFNGTFGTYTQQNVEKQRSYNLPEWKALTEETQHQPPAKRGERRRNQEKVVRGGGNLRSRVSLGAEQEDSPQAKRKPGRPRRNPLPEAAGSEAESNDKHRTSSAVSPTPNTTAAKPSDAKKPAKARGRSSKGGGQAKSVTSRRLNNTAEAADHIDEAAFRNFDYRMQDLDEFTPERCNELETHYWKSLAFNQPMYAADMPGSLFDDTTTSWNVAKLENLLDILGTKVPGVNTAYLYMGMWKATFAWHLEDVDLYSINYIHFGAPKQWYSISQEDARKFEAAMRNIWPVDAKNCDQFLRHKTYLISPDVLQKQYNVKVNKLVHYEGEFVITYPYGYHSGYNLGYNCAESVNFATESWLEYGRIARKCNCEADNVWVDVAEIERKLRGEPTPEYYEETDDEGDLSDEEGGNLPSPPASVKGKAQRGRKRKRDVKEEKPKKKKKIKIRIRLSTREPCVMCPNDNPWEPLLPTENGKKAHRSCALFTPETWIDRDANGKEKACGVATIDRARLELKCNFCRSKRGACFQCSSKKCTRAFHATCALAAGVQIDAGMVPTFGEDGTEYFEEGFDFRCRYHRPKMPKVVNTETLESSKRVISYAKDLQPNDVVQAQYIGAEVFAGLVVENRPNELSVLVDVILDGERVEIEYKWLCVLNPDDSLRPKPSADAVPMPEGMNKKAVSVNNRQDGVPEQGQAFFDDEQYRFQEFYNIHMPPPGYQAVQLHTPLKLSVSVDEPHQLYYYLPKVSTEAKCLFTDKPGSKEMAPKANFLDRVSTKPTFQHATQRKSVGAGAPKSHIPPRLAAAQAPMRQSSAVPPASTNSYTEYRPYMYKPREESKSNGMCGIDSQSLATQRSFLAEAGRRLSGYELPQPNPNGPGSDYHGSDPADNVTPLRSFPRDHYYSADVLPAAFPGEYSGFRQAVRRQSQSMQSLARPEVQSTPFTPNYQSVNQQKAQLRQGAPTVPMMGGGTVACQSDMQPSYGSSSSRPSSSAHSQYSRPAAPSTPATSTSSVSKAPEAPPGFLDNIRQYPYLLNSYLRKDKVYQSPYPIGGGFSSPYQPLALNGGSEQAKSFALHTPSGSLSLVNAERRASQQWTPPSQIWSQNGIAKQPYTDRLVPSLHPTQAPPSQRPQATHQTAYEFQQSFQPNNTPSTASRDGAQARAMRDQGYGPYAPHAYVAQNRNSFGHAYDTAKMWQSPQAPTPSPLSDPNTPGAVPTRGPISNPLYQGPTQVDVAPMGQWPLHGGHGPMLPQIQGGNETWRYN